MQALPHDPKLTKSRISAFFECPKKHHILYELGLRPGLPSEALRMGSAYHYGQEMADAIGLTDALEEVRDRYARTKPGGVDEHAWQVECVTVLCLLIAHHRHWERYGQVTEVLETEKAFEIPLRNPATGMPSRTWTLAGKRDKIVQLTDGRVALQEYKTTSSDVSPESDYWDALAHDLQVSLYWLSALEEGHDVRAVLYDVARKPGIRPKAVYERDENGDKIVRDEDGERVFKKNGEPRQTGSSKKGYTPQKRLETPTEYGERLLDDIQDRPDFYLQRRILSRIDRDLEVTRHDLWNTGKLIRACQVKEWWPHNWSACDHYGQCVCWELCHNDWQPEDGLPDGWRQVEDVHQELVDAE